MLELAPTKPECVDFQMYSADGAEICWLPPRVIYFLIFFSPGEHLCQLSQYNSISAICLNAEFWLQSGGAVGFLCWASGSFWQCNLMNPGLPVLFLLCKCRALHLPSVLNPALKGALIETLWQILPQKFNRKARAPWMLVLTRPRWETLAVAEMAEGSRASTRCIRSVCQAANSISTTANPSPLPLLQKMITWDGKRIDGWGCHLQLKSESLSVGTKMKVYITGGNLCC